MGPSTVPSGDEYEDCTTGGGLGSSSLKGGGRLRSGQSLLHLSLRGCLSRALCCQLLLRGSGRRMVRRGHHHDPTRSNKVTAPAIGRAATALIMLMRPQVPIPADGVQVRGRTVLLHRKNPLPVTMVGRQTPVCVCWLSLSETVPDRGDRYHGDWC